jgi:putative transposase
MHVVQRGNDRRDMFRDREDLAFFLSCAGFAARRHCVSVHAYVLMGNHIHLLATPAEASSLPLMMQAIGRVYVKYFNRRHRRVGALWEGRYRAGFVDDAAYVFTCMRYIELNPVRAGMASTPGAYPWSSFHANALGHPDDLVAPHALYRGLASTSSGRCDTYRALFGTTVSSGELDRIRDATRFDRSLRGQTLPNF